MRVPKALADVVRVVVIVRMFMVAAVIGDPVHRRVLEGGRTENQRDQTHRPKRLERHVGEQAVIAERDAQTRRDHEEEKHSNLERIGAEKPQIERYSGESDESSSDQERTVEP